MCRWRATYRCKDLNKGYNFLFDLTSIGSFHKKLWASKVGRVPILIISGLQLRSPGKKWHLRGSPVAKHKEYYKGEGGGFPQVQIVVSLVSPCLPIATLTLGSRPRQKGLQGCGPRGSPGVTSETPGSVGECEGVSLHTPKATPKLGEGVSMDSQNFRERFEGSNLNGLLRSLYQWKALEA